MDTYVSIFGCKHLQAVYKLVQWQYAGECASCKLLFQDVHRQCAKVCASCILLILQTWKLPQKLSSFHKWFPTCALGVYTLAHHLSTYMHNVVSKLCTTLFRAVLARSYFYASKHQKYQLTTLSWRKSSSVCMHVGNTLHL